MKTCTKCGESKELEEFSKEFKKRDNKYVYRAQCKACRRIYRSQEERKEAQRTRAREQWRDNEAYRRKRMNEHNVFKYGITLDEKEQMLAAQGGCDICGTIVPGGRGWHVDHDHSCCPGDRSCGKCVRGILCANCNLGIGYFEDSPEFLAAAIGYLERYKT